VAVDPAAHPQLAVSPAPVAPDVPQQDSFAAGSQHDDCTDEAQQDEGSDMRMDHLQTNREISMCRDRSARSATQQVFSICCLSMRSLPLVQCCAPLAEPALSESDAKQLERVFKALADRHRVRILNRLLSAGGEAVCVCEFEDMLGLKQSTTSYHLKQLLDAGIVEREKRGSYAYFSIADGALQHVCALLGYAVEPAAPVGAAA
jgi:ArsR family transcriptional regulator